MLNMTDNINHIDRNGVMQGYWKERGDNWGITDDNGNTIHTSYEGFYVDDRREGVWKYTSGDKLTYIDHFVKGLYDGEIIKFVYEKEPVNYED